jgi:hypothetical protein
MWANPGVKRLDEMLAKILHESLCAMAHEELHTPQTAARLRAITSLRWFWSITVNGPMIDGTRGDPGGAKAQFQKTGTRRRCGRSWGDRVTSELRPSGLGSGSTSYFVCTGEWETGRIYQTRGGPDSLRWFCSMTVDRPMTRSGRVATRHLVSNELPWPFG